ncbi:RES family NAD+ phosphorylase [Mucilaginibacter arboris]|uniref:RES domain-containing protein n=1 Tax=Mucilaginibacter arboris TaxID=2682090 RepID=A0A7K1SUD8_9SPHI|nr:RES family NAD+ phosphorylase [Mucilaginibacter arboris]MVN20936.1 RES domain-containing protein [Mucilaginibacter arboris]
MEVFRIVKEAFAQELTASGAANRWNKANQFVIYTGSSRSLSTLELVVHRNNIMPAFAYRMLIISIADEESLITTIRQNDLPETWRSISAYSKLQQIGSDWYKSKRSLILKVPSAIISQEYNYLINTKHPVFESKVSLVRTENYFWDERLV